MKRTLTLLALALATTASLAATPSEAQIDAAMKKADPDNDGTLDLKEALRFGIPKKIFEASNPDKDGTLDRKEFLAAVTALFEASNPDKDGTLDWKEARKAGIRSKKTFDAANPDKDGTLDLAEFLVALTAQAR